MSGNKHSIFVVGRMVKGESRLVFVKNPAPAPFPGPWELRAVFAN
ncbi:hypothetical protein BH23GEM6_BH23GEM6_10230 [soil metagenome]